jgi:hypothetical protein
LAVFWLSAILVLAVTLFPQAFASFLADRLPDFSGSTAAHLEELNSLDAFKTEFNRASGERRIILLFSPT